jgi:hypothetical protein
MVGRSLAFHWPRKTGHIGVRIIFTTFTTYVVAQGEVELLNSELGFHLFLVIPRPVATLPTPTT